MCKVVLQRLHSVVGVQPVRRVLCEVVLQRLHLLKNPIVCNCIGPILLILLVIACIVFNCVLPVFNKEYDDDDGGGFLFAFHSNYRRICSRL